MARTWPAVGPNAENIVVGSARPADRGLIYLSYTQLAVYDAVVAIQGGYAPMAPASADAGATAEAAVVQAAYDTLVHYFPGARHPRPGARVLTRLDRR